MLLIIWDFDGTLANSEKKFKDIVYNFITEKMGQFALKIEDFTDEFYYKNCAGKKYSETFKILEENGIIEDNKIKNEELDYFLKYCNESYAKMEVGDIKLTKNMDKLLKKLTERKIPMCIATSAKKGDFELKRKSLNNPIINKMEGYSCEELKDNYRYLNLDKYNVKNKPNPAIFIYATEKAMEKCNEINNIIVIEDSSSGCLAGKNFAESDFAKENKFNVKVIGYTGGDHKPDGEILLSSGADVISENTDELLEIIDLY